MDKDELIEILGDLWLRANGFDHGFYNDEIIDDFANKVLRLLKNKNVGRVAKITPAKGLKK